MPKFNRERMMTARKIVATLFVVATLTAGTAPASAQTDASSPRLSSPSANVPAPQIEPLFLALFGAGAIGLGLFLRRYLTD